MTKQPVNCVTVVPRHCDLNVAIKCPEIDKDACRGSPDANDSLEQVTLPLCRPSHHAPANQRRLPCAFRKKKGRDREVGGALLSGSGRPCDGHADLISGGFGAGTSQPPVHHSNNNAPSRLHQIQPSPPHIQYPHGGWASLACYLSLPILRKPQSSTMPPESPRKSVKWWDGRLTGEDSIV